MAIREWVRQRLKKQAEQEEARVRIKNACPEVWDGLRIAVKEGIEEYRDVKKWGRYEFNGGGSNVFSAAHSADTPNTNTLLKKLVLKLEDERITVTYSGPEVKHEPISITFAVDEKTEQVTLFREGNLTTEQAAIAVLQPFLFPEL